MNTCSYGGVMGVEKEHYRGRSRIGVYPGQYYDGESGLHYNWNRYYEPGSGRYNSLDPIGYNEEHVSLYCYSGDDPINWFDPFGLTREDVESMLELAKETQPDLRVPDEVSITNLGGDTIGFANPLSPGRGIYVDDRYLEELSCKQMEELFEVIVHESIHRTKPRWDSIKRPLKHPDIYDEAKKRKDEQLDRIKEKCKPEC